jgi:cell division protease FtsH
MTESNDSGKDRRSLKLPKREDQGPGKGRRGLPQGRPLRTLTLWIALTLITVLVIQFYYTARPKEQEIPYDRLMREIQAGNIKKIEMVDKEVTGELSSEGKITVEGKDVSFTNFKSYLPVEDPDLPKLIMQKNPNAEIKSKAEGTPWAGILITWLPILLIVGFWLFVIRQMQSGGSTAMKFGKSKAKILLESAPRVTFKDVAGADEAKQELQEVIEFLKDPRKFQTLGGRIPKGALLLGPPGTGKTLLARAVAGEAAVPFFSMSGSDFVEMFVGVGASRVRDLFEQGKKHAPCIIFIDEIDAVGRHRGAGLGGGHDEREQTLNQLLVEMDGFESNEGVILIAATNRPDVLDPALLRPGRFDRQIVVDWPDVRGREGILKVHTRKIPLEDDVNLKVLARGTPGMSGADLANMVNEAALLAARRNHKKVTGLDFEDAKDKVMMGTERRSLIMSEDERKTTSLHEAGHALVAWLLPNTDPVHKVTIIPRGTALGVTHFLPVDEKHNLSKSYLLSVLTVDMGGRAAEKLVLNQLSNGAAMDIEHATNLARRMVCAWGMSEKLGPLTFGKREEMIFLGKEISQQRDYSERTALMIDEEVRNIVEGAYQKAYELLDNNRDKLDSLSNALLEREILDHEEIDKVLSGEELEPLPKTRRGAAEESGGSAPGEEREASGGPEADRAEAGDGGDGGAPGEVGADSGGESDRGQPEPEAGEAAGDKGTKS